MEANNQNNYTAIQVLEDPIVEYKNGSKELFGALYITDTLTLTGRIIEEDDHTIFVAEGGIPQHRITRIIGGKTRQVCQKG